MDSLRHYLTIFLISILCSHSSFAHIKLLDPQGGESFVPGEVIIISWEEEQTHMAIDFDLYFSSDGGETWEEIASLNVDRLEYTWTVPDIETEQGKIRVIQDNEDMDYIDISPNFRISKTEIVTAIEDSRDPAPFEILSNYPNPFQSLTTIEFTLPQYSHVSLEVYNLQGAKVATLTDEVLSAGTYATPWNATGNRPGLYLALVRVGTFIETRKLIKLE
ncbi:MAG: T9SS type A sorting domain-containing protein [Bacteroidetes bacterium]|nr:MAG: T9SS type A sorting domain-containing protein [Bacteroidota bacterium]